jgi:glycosyltransferase involved in cell wall biosynthesis
MIKNKQREIVVVYTKQFPFGFKEAYILDEVKALSVHFDDVYFLPYAEFEFKPDESRIQLNARFHVLNFGANPASRNLWQKISSIFSIVPILFKESFFSRQKIESLKRIKQNFFRLYHYSWIAQQLESWLKTQKGHITHYHYWMHDGVMIDMMAKNHQPHRHVARSHSIDCYHKDWPLAGYAPYEIQKIKYLDAIYSVSRHGLNHLQRTFPKWSNKFFYQPLGITFEKVPTISHPKPIILTLAFMGKVKNMPRMVDLMVELKDHFQWVHIGSGVQEIQNQISASCQENNIHFTSWGYMSKDEIYDFLAKQNIAFFANTSIWEGVPVSLMEAGIHGIPMIVTDIPGNKEVVNFENGFILPLKGSLREEALQIIAVFQNKQAWLKLAEHAQSHIIAEYSAEKNHQHFFSEVKKLTLK